jgi:hypothetical protein
MARCALFGSNRMQRRAWDNGCIRPPTLPPIHPMHPPTPPTQPISVLCRQHPPDTTLSTSCNCPTLGHIRQHPPGSTQQPAAPT